MATGSRDHVVTWQREDVANRSGIAYLDRTSRAAVGMREAGRAVMASPQLSATALEQAHKVKPGGNRLLSTKIRMSHDRRAVNL